MIFATALRDDERELFQRELDAFVPPRVFDAHAHLYERSHFGPQSFANAYVDTMPQRMTLADYRRHVAGLLPGRTVEGLFIPMALDGDPAVINGFIAEQVRPQPRSRGAMVVRPEMEPDYIRQEVRRGGFASLKCYHLLAANKPAGPSWDADIPDYLPEHIVRVADECRLSIILHMVKLRALADPRNQEAIRHYCRTYPNMRMVLAHAARGFNPHHTVEGIGSLKGLQNVWFDTSAVTDCGAIEAIIDTFGHERVMWGSDFYVSHFRGRCVAIADSFVWLYEDSVDWSSAMHTRLQPVVVGLESLRCLKLAARHARLSDRQVDDLFWGNAARLYGIE